MVKSHSDSWARPAFEPRERCFYFSRIGDPRFARMLFVPLEMGENRIKGSRRRGALVSASRRNQQCLGARFIIYFMKPKSPGRLFLFYWEKTGPAVQAARLAGEGRLVEMEDRKKEGFFKPLAT